MRVISYLLSFLFAILLGCSSSSNIKQPEYVELILSDGNKIRAQILQIDRDQVVIDARNWKDAYEYGESIPRIRIEGVKLSDGMVLTLDEYEASRRGIVSKREKGKQKAGASKKVSAPGEENFHYDQLQGKQISEMTENEFRYFMAMKEKEWQEEAAKHDLDARAEELERAYEDAIGNRKAETLPQKSEPRVRSRAELERSVASLLDAGLAPTYMLYLDKKSRAGVPLDETEAQMKDLIERNPKWHEMREDLEYLNRTAEKALSRAYLYNPEDLQTKLSLKFNPDSDMDYDDLIGQLHLSMGEDVKMRDYRKLVDVFGDSGGRALKELLENYPDMQLLKHEESAFLAR